MAGKLDFISLADNSTEALRHLLDVAIRLKKQFKETRRTDRVAEGKTLACIFEKPSLRTRVSFEVAIYDLGGTAIYISPGEIGLGTRESVSDAAKVLSGMVDGIMARAAEYMENTPAPERCTQTMLEWIARQVGPLPS